MVFGLFLKLLEKFLSFFQFPIVNAAGTGNTMSGLEKSKDCEEAERILEKKLRKAGKCKEISAQKYLALVEGVFSAASNPTPRGAAVAVAKIGIKGGYCEISSYLLRCSTSTSELTQAEMDVLNKCVSSKKTD